MILLQNIPPAFSKRLMAYACEVVRNFAFNRPEYSLAEKRSIKRERPLDELEAVVSDLKTEMIFSDVKFSMILDRFLRRLGKEARVVFLKRYFFMDSVPEISKDLGISESKITSMFFIIRKKLHEAYRKGEKPP